MPDYSSPKATLSKGYPSPVRIQQRSSERSSFVDPTKASRELTLRTYQPDLNSLLKKSVAFYAEPLAPLRAGDALALEAIFNDTQIDERLTDICIRLEQLHPEPCWEDEPYDFLKGYV
ncbi:MAG: hypothetical protein AAGI45_05655 [Cyanobacteria bacterium P01_H01_bin.26]